MRDPSTLLHDLLDQGLVWHPEYAGGLSNHLPMALHALAALGADAGQLQRFHDRHAQRLHRRDAAPDDGFEARWAEVSAELARDGRDAVLRRRLPRLMPGIAAAAFHGAIRTAHAVAAGHDGELAMGLAYWGHRQMPLVALPPARGDLPLPDWLDALDALQPTAAVEGRMITRRMRLWATQPGFAALAPRLQPEANTLPELARAAAARYAASGNFTVLHMVTACHAVHQLLPWIGDEDSALRHASVAAAAAWKAAAAADGEAPAPRPWRDIVQHALDADDEHVIKLVHAARELDQQLGGEAFRRAATRATIRQEMPA